MLKAFKFFVALLIFVVAAGCAMQNSAKVAATVDKDFVNVYDAFFQLHCGVFVARKGLFFSIPHHIVVSR